MRTKVLICGVLPPPYFGHSMLYECLMTSEFPRAFEIRFLNMHFWSYESDKKVTGGKIFSMVKYYAQLIGLLVTFRPSMVLYNTSFYKMPFPKDFLFCSTSIVLGARLVIHDHGQYVRELHDSLGWFGRRLLRWLLKHMTASIIMGERVRPVYQGLCDGKKLFAVPGSVYDSKPIAAEPNVPPSHLKNVLYFSHLSKPKGVDIAFAVAAEVLKADRSVAFTFGGPIASNDIAKDLERLQSEYPGRVRYMGYISDPAERTALFRGADVFLFTTVRDVFGLVLLHAMAEGVPIVAPEEGTIPEIVIHGENGFIVKKGDIPGFRDRVLQILKDKALSDKIQANNRRRYEDRYHPEKYAQVMVEAMNAIDKGAQ